VAPKYQQMLYGFIQKNVGEFNVHLLSNYPMALSIGKQVAKGRTFVWQQGKTFSGPGPQEVQGLVFEGALVYAEQPCSQRPSQGNQKP